MSIFKSSLRLCLALISFSSWVALSAGCSSEAGNPVTAISVCGRMDGVNTSGGETFAQLNVSTEPKKIDIQDKGDTRFVYGTGYLSGPFLFKAQDDGTYCGTFQTGFGNYPEVDEIFSSYLTDLTVGDIVGHDAYGNAQFDWIDLRVVSCSVRGAQLSLVVEPAPHTVFEPVRLSEICDQP